VRPWPSESRSKPGAYVRVLGGGYLGPVEERFVSFDSAGNSGYETFKLSNPTFHNRGVSINDLWWRWQWREKPSDAWRELTIHGTVCM
jgi:hypothetical protein